jgi:lipoate-protein ligase A
MEIVNVARSRITSITDELKRDVSLNEVESALVDGFQKALGNKLGYSDLTRYELGLARRLFEAKYSTSNWNCKGRNED